VAGDDAPDGPVEALSSSRCQRFSAQGHEWTLKAGQIAKFVALCGETRSGADGRCTYHGTAEPCPICSAALLQTLAHAVAAMALYRHMTRREPPN
jgi:hypothetical protein